MESLRGEKNEHCANRDKIMKFGTPAKYHSLMKIIKGDTSEKSREC